MSLMNVSPWMVMSGFIQMGQNARTGIERPSALRPRAARGSRADEFTHRRVAFDPEDAREPREVREAVGDAPRKGHVDADPAPASASRSDARVLLLVGEDQIGLERAHVVDPRILRPADARDARDHVLGQLAVVRPADERPGAAERRDARAYRSAPARRRAAAAR